MTATKGNPAKGGGGGEGALWTGDKADAVKQQGDCNVSSSELTIVW